MNVFVLLLLHDQYRLLKGYVEGVESFVEGDINKCNKVGTILQNYKC